MRHQNESISKIGEIDSKSDFSAPETALQASKGGIS